MLNSKRWLALTLTPLSSRSFAPWVLTTLLAFAPLVAAAPGDVESIFDPNVNGDFLSVRSTAMQPDGKILIGGTFSTVGGVTRNRIARLNADGTLDPNFNPNAGADHSSIVESMAVQADGKILVVGTFTTMGGVERNRIARLDADGSLDINLDLNANNYVRSTAVQADGKVIIGGNFTALGAVARNRIARLNVDGTLDPTFAPNVDNYINGTAVQPDGKILIGGGFSMVGGIARNRIARLNADGTLDLDFNPNASAPVFCMALQVDGKIILAGQFGFIGGIARKRIARLNVDGTLDSGFDLILTNSVWCTAVQTDGKITIAGQSTVNGAMDTYVAQINADGTLDTAFNANIAGDPPLVPWVYGMAMQGDGKIVIGGDFTSVGGLPRNRIARLVNAPVVQNLTVSSVNRVEWLRGGALPETQQVTFELTTDSGNTWSRLGVGTRISGGWELIGVSLPVSGQIRARARVISGGNNGSSGLVESVTAFTVTQPSVTAAWSGNGLTLLWPETATGYRVEAATNLNPPIIWRSVTGSFQTNGGSISIALPTSGSENFYRLVKP